MASGVTGVSDCQDQKSSPVVSCAVRHDERFFVFLRLDREMPSTATEMPIGVLTRPLDIIWRIVRHRDFHAGEYVFVSSQSDTEKPDLARERKELSENAEFELDELAEIYVERGVDRVLGRHLARQLMARRALGFRKSPPHVPCRPP
jgi:hypothetical protein